MLDPLWLSDCRTERWRCILSTTFLSGLAARAGRDHISRGRSVDGLFFGADRFGRAVGSSLEDKKPMLRRRERYSRTGKPISVCHEHVALSVPLPKLTRRYAIGSAGRPEEPCEFRPDLPSRCASRAANQPRARCHCSSRLQSHFGWHARARLRRPASRPSFRLVPTDWSARAPLKATRH
jgi:hypothetical protein